MKFTNSSAKLYIPDGSETGKALERTTVLCIAAHQDDIEIMAYSHIAKCLGSSKEWFTGVVVTDGGGSPRSGIYENYTDEEMKTVRIEEQKQAADIGKYSAQFLLGYPSAEVKSGVKRDKNSDKDTNMFKNADANKVTSEIINIIEQCSPEIILTHNLFDKHDTHVAVVLRVIQALRTIYNGKNAAILRGGCKVYSMEVWRGLDWLNDESKEVFDTSAHPNIAASLLGVFDSQIAGGKRYDLASIGRRLANATFYASHSVDNSDSVSYGIEITDFIKNPDMTYEDFINIHIENFRKDVLDRIRRYS